MKPYLTAQKFRNMGFGIDLTETEDPILSIYCQRASAMIDAYCRVPRVPAGQNHDFRGGTATGEQHTWRYPSGPTDIGQRKLWPFHWPVKAVSQFRIKVTNTQYVEIAPSELFINNTDRYIEVVSLAITSHGLFQALVVPNIGLATPVAEIDYTYGTIYNEVEERLISTDGQTWRAQHQWWDTAAENEPIIENGGVVVDPADYTVDYDEGVIRFGDDVEDDAVVTAAYSHTLPWEIRDAAGHIVAYLWGDAENRSRGMGSLRRLTVEEVTLERQKASEKASDNFDLEALVPEAAMLLNTYRFDGVAIR